MRIRKKTAFDGHCGSRDVFHQKDSIGSRFAHPLVFGIQEAAELLLQRLGQFHAGRPVKHLGAGILRLRKLIQVNAEKRTVRILLRKSQTGFQIGIFIFTCARTFTKIQGGLVVSRHQCVRAAEFQNRLGLLRNGQRDGCLAHTVRRDRAAIQTAVSCVQDHIYLQAGLPCRKFGLAVDGDHQYYSNQCE